MDSLILLARRRRAKPITTTTGHRPTWSELCDAITAAGGCAALWPGADVIALRPGRDGTITVRGERLPPLPPR